MKFIILNAVIAIALLTIASYAKAGNGYTLTVSGFSRIDDCSIEGMEFKRRGLTFECAVAK